MKTYWIKRFWVIGVGLLPFAWSCQPEPDSIKLLDELVVSTTYDNAVDFQTYSTYSIATDTLGFVSNQANDTILIQAKTDYPRPVLQKVIGNLNALGYTKVNKSDNPDMRINVYIVNDFNLFQQVIYPDYYYPSYYGYGYGYGSYYAYPYVNTYATNTGSLVIEILDLKNVTPDNKVKVIWGAYMGDVYSTIDLIKQSEKAIDQAFVQSPYLHK
ncbi:MAG TPA: DUF4136 domain-containing protein [Chryseolinea sp.]|nr:DUF4136 domain-containing protein [Chryseolinea sp.]